MMSTWQIFSDAGNNFRWEISPQDLKTPKSSDLIQLDESCSSPNRFSSFEDVLLQGCSTILDDCDNGDGDKTPLFRTGLGNSVALKKSSIEKASSVFGDEFSGIDSGQPFFPGNGFCSPNSMFQTGSGKMVNISSERLNKAKALLGMDETNDDSNIEGGFEPANKKFRGNERYPCKKMSTKGVQIGVGTESSSIDTGRSCFPGNGFISPSSMFQTGSGKKVNISSAGLNRAKALLSMEESNDDSKIEGFEHANQKFRGSDKDPCEKSSRKMILNSVEAENGALSTKESIHLTKLTGNGFVDKNFGKFVQPDMYSSSKPSPIKFNTAGGRSISVSSDALQRARSLLGDPEMGNLSDEGDASASMFSCFKKDYSDGKTFDSDGKFFKRARHSESSLMHHQLERSEQNPKIFVSPMRSSFHRKPLEAKSDTVLSGTNLLSKFNAEEIVSESNGNLPCQEKPLQEKPIVPDNVQQLSESNGLSSGIHRLKRPSIPLSDITNNIGTDSARRKGVTTELRRFSKRNSVSPFKRPRNSKFVTPLNSNLSSVPTVLSSTVSEVSYSRKRVSSHYPVQLSRTYMKDFFKEPPTHRIKLEHLSEQVRLINSHNSEKYMFCDGSQLVGVDAFYHMLAQSGASMQHASKEWVANHYKWIVWKLASYERCYPDKFMKKFLTISNVLDELKYRYEREVNHGQRSAIKRILEGDASPSSTLVLCVSAICSGSEIETPGMNGAEKSSIGRVELTDGWYSINATLDVLLSKHLATGKLFVGQKLRICGAGLNGWSEPVSPLEASATINLLLHINGTYRAGWADRLGFCRGVCAPLAFRCVKSNGGAIPRTLVGVKRIYPVLFRERLKSGGYIVRSEKMEAALSQVYNQRRSNIVEAYTSDFQRGTDGSFVLNDCDNEEGARILKMLESAAEPELLMAEMSSEQLASFSMYQAKVEASRQSDLKKVIEKALESAGLTARDVTPFMRVRVVGLKSYGPAEANDGREGLITIWNPTERQKIELAEGQAYAVSGLLPLNSDCNTLYLQARGPSTKWQPISTKEKESFVPFFKPRKAVSISRIGEVPLSSDFDTAVLVLHVGLEFIAGQQKRQWAFVTDGSLCDLQTEESTISLLAISFCSPCTEDDSVSPVNCNLVGSIITGGGAFAHIEQPGACCGRHFYLTFAPLFNDCFEEAYMVKVGFCNLVKRTKDHVNNMWVAEATENSTYYLNYDQRYCSHLKDACASVKKWQQSSSLTIEKLKEKVLYIVGGPKD